MADTDPNEFVYITHNNVNAIGGPVTRRAFEEVHKAKGWKLATAEQVEAAESGAPLKPSSTPAK